MAYFPARYHGLALYRVAQLAHDGGLKGGDVLVASPVVDESRRQGGCGKDLQKRTPVGSGVHLDRDVFSPRCHADPPAHHDTEVDLVDLTLLKPLGRVECDGRRRRQDRLRRVRRNGNSLS